MPHNQEINGSIPTCIQVAETNLFSSVCLRHISHADIFFDKISEHSLDTYDEVDVLRLRATQALWAE